MRDDLIDSQELLRDDDKERREIMAVQLDEAKAFLARGTVSHARLAFILLDNAAEVIMRRNVEVRLMLNPVMERLLERWKEILKQHPDNAEAQRQHDETARKVVPRSMRKKLAHLFDAKVDFIQRQGDLQETEARVLKKLHWYRNELYHRDHIRPETVRSACLLYFDIACTLFERLSQDVISTTASTHLEVPQTLKKFNADEAATGYPTEGQITATLRADLGIDEVGLKEILAAHLASRLDALDEAISRVEKVLFAAGVELMPSGPWRRATIHLAQRQDEAFPDSIEELLATPVQYSEADLAGWRQKVADLREAGDRLELFAAFADVEDAFEPFEEQMTDLDVRVEHEVERELDLQRGK